MIKDKDTGNPKLNGLKIGMVYDIRNADKIQITSCKQEYLQKLKKRHKSAWQGWWQQKRENNQSLIQFVKRNNSKELSDLLNTSSKDLRPEINIRDDCGTPRYWYILVGIRELPDPLRLR